MGGVVRVQPEDALARAHLLGRFSVTQLAADLHASEVRIRKFIQAWIDDGKVAFIGQGPKRRKIYEVSAIRTPEEEPKGTPQTNMWRTMRKARIFSAVDVELMSRTGEVDVNSVMAKKYCRLLCNAGYLNAEVKAVPGKQQAVYRLIRDTGPIPPQPRRVRAVWDGNLGEFTHVAGVSS